MTMTGSIRKRGTASWELRVYAGTDPETGRRRYQTKTVRGNKADARRELKALVARVEAIRATGSDSPVSELLEAWVATAVVSWAPTTIRQTRSVIDRYLLPGLGHVRIGDVTPAMTDAQQWGRRIEAGYPSDVVPGQRLVLPRCCGFSAPVAALCDLIESRRNSTVPQGSLAMSAHHADAEMGLVRPFGLRPRPTARRTERIV